MRSLHVVATAVLLTAASPTVSALPGQSTRSTPPAAARAKVAPPKAGDGISGSYVGTATVPLGDSTLVVPVTYVFSGVAPAITGTAMVPGQGTGAISNVMRDGARLRFRVTAGEGKLLEHDGQMAPDGRIEGFVNLDGKPVAKFRIAPGSLPAKPAPAAPAPKNRGRAGG